MESLLEIARAKAILNLICVCSTLVWNELLVEKYSFNSMSCSFTGSVSPCKETANPEVSDCNIFVKKELL